MSVRPWIGRINTLHNCRPFRHTETALVDTAALNRRRDIRDGERTRDDDDGGTSGTLSQTVNIVGPAFTSSVAPNATIDFGEVDLGQLGTFVLNIQNTTPDGDLGDLTDLTISSASLISGPDAGDFTILGLGANQIIPAGGSLNLVIQFTPDMPIGEHMATLTLFTDQNAAFAGAGGLATGDQFVFQLFAVATPEPGTLALWLLLGLCGCGWATVRRVRVYIA